VTTELEPYQPNQPATTVIVHQDTDSWIAVIGEVAKLASHIADTDFVPAALRGNPAAVAAAILAGREAGVPPVTSLQHINVIKGKPGQSAQLMRQLALAAGHHIRYIETTDSRCIVEGCRRGEQRWERVTFTADQARKARIDLGGYPEDKLVARATTRLCRRLFADAIGGMSYSVEELEDGTATPDADIIVATPATPEKRVVQRKSAQKHPEPIQAPPAPQPPIVEQDEPQGPPLPGEDITDNDAPDPDPVTPAQLKKLHTVFTKHNIKDRGDRLVVASQCAGRDLQTSTELTKTEANTVLDTLDRIEAIAGEDFGDFVGRLAAAIIGATQTSSIADIDPDTGEVIG
jgi:hypothetical protein